MYLVREQPYRIPSTYLPRPSSILPKYSLVQQNSALKTCGKRQSHPIDKKEQELAVASLPFAKSNLNLCQSRPSRRLLLYM